MSGKTKNFKLSDQNKIAMLGVAKDNVDGSIRRIDHDSKSMKKVARLLNEFFGRSDRVSAWKDRLYKAAIWEANPKQAEGGKKVREWMAKNNVQQKELAKKVGYVGSMTTFSRILDAYSEIGDSLSTSIFELTGHRLGKNNLNQLEIKVLRQDKPLADMVSREQVERSAIAFIEKSYTDKIDGAIKVLDEAFTRLKKRRQKPGKQNDVHIDVQVVSMALSCLTGKPMTEFLL